MQSTSSETNSRHKVIQKVRTSLYFLNMQCNYYYYCCNNFMFPCLSLTFNIPFQINCQERESEEGIEDVTHQGMVTFYNFQ